MATTRATITRVVLLSSSSSDSAGAAVVSVVGASVVAVMSPWPLSPSDAVSATVGIGCSGSSPLAGVGSIQLTSSPSSYVWIAGKPTESASGSGPTEIQNWSNWPGPI